MDFPNTQAMDDDGPATQRFSDEDDDDKNTLVIFYNFNQVKLKLFFCNGYSFVYLGCYVINGQQNTLNILWRNVFDWKASRLSNYS